jgi:hypothetical protein
MVLAVYGDESADSKKERVFAVAGVVASEREWRVLESQWLERTGGVPFHATDCDTDRDVYASRPHAANKELYRDLTTLLANCQEMAGWAFVIDMKAQRRVFPDAPDLAYFKGFFEVVNAMTIFARNNNETVRFTFDVRQESDYNAGLLYSMYHEDWRDHLEADLAFESAKQNSRIQVADLFAREAMKAMDNALGPVRRPARASWRALNATGRFHLVGVSDEWFLDLKRKLPELERDVLVSMTGEYPQWLAARRLHDNDTNRFRYLRWCKAKMR